MPSYFRQVPDFEYVSRDAGQKQISEYATVKNLFRRGKLREDIFGNLSYFTKYSIIGDERPDNVAYKVYNDETLDWVILLSNNILNVQNEWPLEQNTFDALMLEKYGSYENINAIKHYVTKEIKDSGGITVLPAGIITENKWKSGKGFVQSIKNNIFFHNYVTSSRITFSFSTNPFPSSLTEDDEVILSGFSNPILNGKFSISNIQRFISPDNRIISFEIEFGTPIDTIILNGNENAEFITRKQLENSNLYYYEYYDSNRKTIEYINSIDFLEPVSNYDYEIELENKKRNIFVLKPSYLNVIFNDLEEIMKYKKGSSQYLSRTLKRGDNIRLYN